MGSVLFANVKEYSSLETWRADADKHLVPSDSPYAFQKGKGKAYGWVVQEKGRLPQALPLPQMRRMMRSIYEMSPLTSSS